MAPFSSISPFSFSSFSFFSFPLPDRAFPLRGKKKKERKSAAGVASTRSFPSLHGFPRPHVLCSWRTAVGSIYSGDHPPPSHVDHGLEGAGRSVSPRKPWDARQEKGYSPPLPPSTSPSSVQAAASQPGPWHFNGVHALLDRKDGTWRGLRLVTRGRKGWRKRLDGSSSKGLGNIWCKIVFKERILELDGDGW